MRKHPYIILVVCVFLAFYGGYFVGHNVDVPRLPSTSSTDVVHSQPSVTGPRNTVADYYAAIGIFTSDPSITTKPTFTPPQRKTPTPKPTAAPKRQTYVLNIRTKKFHYPDCRSVKKMNDSNKKEVTWSRTEIIIKGYSPCGNCNP